MKLSDVKSGRSALLFFVLHCIWNRATAQIRYSIPEELQPGAVVGNIAKDLGYDVEKLTERGLRIVSGSKQQLFTVNERNGELLVKENVDREALCGRSSECFVSIKTVLDHPLEVQHVEVDITDINDHSPSFSAKERRLEIAESATAGTRFPLESAHDPDVGTNSLRSYRLSQNKYFDLEVQDDSDDSKVPVLILQRTLDREINAEHILILSAFDGGNPARTGTLNISVSVLDINDNAPAFDQQTYKVTLLENVPVGTFVVKVHATDPDSGPNGEIEYSFGNTFRSKILELFDLDARTGEIRVKGRIDYEETKVHKIDVQATDKGPAPMSVHCSVIVKIEDVNDNTPDIEVTSLSDVISEGARAGTTVALISVSDGDAGENAQIVCQLSEGVPFELKPSFRKNFYSVISTGPLDRETTPVYSMTITARDLGTPPLSSITEIAVRLSDINDNSPRFSENNYMLYLYENNVPGASIFSVSATDADEQENAIVSYALSKNQVDDRINPFLNINPENGIIYALKSFDFETLKTFQFHVAATDSGTPSLSSNVTVHVFILDQNDNAPVILSPVSANGSAEGVEEIPRNVNAGHSVAKVRAYDADIGYNAWLSFSLQHATDASLFGLERYTGQIRTLRSFTETDEAEHKLVILVKDNGNVSLSATATVIIKAVEPKEAFAASDTESAVQTEEENNVTFYLIITLSCVSALFLLSIIGLIVMQCSKPPDYSPKYSRDPNYADTSGNGTLCHSIQYRSGDKRYMLVGPRMSIGSAIVPGSNANTLMVPDHRRGTSGEPKAPNADWRYSASLRAGMQSSVHMEESSVMQGAQGVLVQNWPTVSSAAGDAEGGEVSPPVGAGMNSNSWHYRYGPGPGYPPQALKPGEVPEAFIIPGSPAIISIRQDQGGPDDKSDFITFGKKEEAKKKKKKKKGKEKKEKGKDGEEE
ncbi:protocadherin alpha-2-like isoform X14 [Anguilla anguilla]|uniref:protocadherin alpha-2-like isoform X14 n=1 Tax=Anguilla anguilla TaxID=7936 RepID=UPI0015A8252C|nr:protocadherin alpha-2-like isoform X14 [Anguilla anguilla]